MPKVTKKITKTKNPVVKKTATETETKTKAISPVVKTPIASTPTYKVAKYLNKNVLISPRKLRLLVNDVKKMSPNEALQRLKFTNTKAARIMVKALNNVIADAKNNFNLDPNSLKFNLIKADEGMKLKRMDKSHSARFARGLIQKRHSRLVIHVKGIQK